MAFLFVLKPEPRTSYWDFLLRLLFSGSSSAPFFLLLVLVPFPYLLLLLVSSFSPTSRATSRFENSLLPGFYLPAIYQPSQCLRLCSSSSSHFLFFCFFWALRRFFFTWHNNYFASALLPLFPASFTSILLLFLFLARFRVLLPQLLLLSELSSSFVLLFFHRVKHRFVATHFHLYAHCVGFRSFTQLTYSFWLLLLILFFLFFLYSFLILDNSPSYYSVWKYEFCVLHVLLLFPFCFLYSLLPYRATIGGNLTSRIISWYVGPLSLFL